MPINIIHRLSSECKKVVGDIVGKIGVFFNEY